MPAAGSRGHDGTLACLCLEHLGLTCLEGLSTHPSVQYLGLMGNPRLCNFYGLPSFPSIVVLDARHCGVTTFAGATRQPSLKALLLSNSPLALHPRVGVMALLAFGPSLMFIDGVAVSAEDRAGAERLGGSDGYAAMCVALGLTSLPSDGSHDATEYFGGMFEQLKEGFLSYARHHVDRRHSFEAVMLRLGAAGDGRSSAVLPAIRQVPEPHCFVGGPEPLPPQPATSSSPPALSPTAGSRTSARTEASHAHEATMMAVLHSKWAAVQRAHDALVSRASTTATMRPNPVSNRRGATTTATPPQHMVASTRPLNSNCQPRAGAKLSRGAAVDAIRGGGGATLLHQSNRRHLGDRGRLANRPLSTPRRSMAEVLRSVHERLPLHNTLAGALEPTACPPTVQLENLSITVVAHGAPSPLRCDAGMLQLCWATRTMCVRCGGVPAQEALAPQHWQCMLRTTDVADVVLIDGTPLHGAYVEVRVKGPLSLPVDAPTGDRNEGLRRPCSERPSSSCSDAERLGVAAIRIQRMRRIAGSDESMVHADKTYDVFHVLLAWRCDGDELRTLYGMPLSP